MDLTKDSEFNEANNMLKAMKKILKENSKAAVDHHEPISSQDLITLRNYFIRNKKSPKVLQQQVFLNIMIHFGRRGRENLRSLKVTDFAITTDDENSLYVYRTTDERTKNHQDDSERKLVRMYQIKGNRFSFISSRTEV